MTEVKVGVIGTGFIGPAHVEALRRLGIEVVAIAGPRRAVVAEKAEAMRIKKYYDSAEALIADSDVNVVHITSPNHAHYPQAKAALLAGKHVVCEKPLALSTVESSELVQLAQAKQLVNAVNFNIRFYPLNHQARHIVRSGALGEVYIVQGSYLQDWLLLPTDWNWRLEPQFSGQMRAVADIGSHWLDLTTFITDLQIEAVLADFATFLKTRQKPTQPVEAFAHRPTVTAYAEQAIGTEDYATVLLRYSNGARGVMTVSQVCAGRKNRLYYEINGAKSSLVWDGERPNELWINHRERPNELLLKDPSLLAPEVQQIASYPGGHDEGFPDTFKQLYRAIYRYLEADDFTAPTDFPTFEDGHRSLRLGEAILRSAQEARWIRMDE